MFQLLPIIGTLIDRSAINFKQFRHFATLILGVFWQKIPLFPPSKSQSTYVYCLENFTQRRHPFQYVRWKPDKPKVPKSFLVRTVHENHNHFVPNYCLLILINPGILCYFFQNFLKHNELGLFHRIYALPKTANSTDPSTLEFKNSHYSPARCCSIKPSVKSHWLVEVPRNSHPFFPIIRFLMAWKKEKLQKRSKNSNWTFEKLIGLTY